MFSLRDEKYTDGFTDENEVLCGTEANRGTGLRLRRKGITWGFVTAGNAFNFNREGRALSEIGKVF